LVHSQFIREGWGAPAVPPVFFFIFVKINQPPLRKLFLSSSFFFLTFRPRPPPTRHNTGVWRVSSPSFLFFFRENTRTPPVLGLGRPLSSDPHTTGSNSFYFLLSGVNEHPSFSSWIAWATPAYGEIFRLIPISACSRSFDGGRGSQAKYASSHQESSPHAKELYLVGNKKSPFFFVFPVRFSIRRSVPADLPLASLDQSEIDSHTNPSSH